MQILQAAGARAAALRSTMRPSGPIHPHRLRNPHSPPFGQRRTFMWGLPRLAFSVLRLPIAFGAAGVGAAGYVHFKMDELSKTYIPDWARDAFDKTANLLGSIDLSKVELPSLPQLDFSKLPLPDLNQGTPSSLPGLEVASSKFESQTKSIVDDGASIGISKRTGTALGGSMDPPPSELMVLTKKLIEIRNLLKTIDNNGSNLKLPSIVVVGSQSSGKSSVLEAIVGHEFLPKGSNMVTRRPIELTLIHTPNSKEEYGEFPQLGLGKVHDFTHIQRTLTDLNLAVPDEECVSSNPIELRIYSQNVPDLTLIDLPGYIQIHNRNQPAVLKQKIADLCESYISEPNIILAVCAADVDLANSEALRASRKADPNGGRTIGVITKMDLVDPNSGVKILQNSDYPLQLGYVGVVCKSGPQKGQTALVRTEEAFFNANADVYRKPKVNVGTPTLRRRLMEVLEERMGKNLFKIVDNVQAELDDARYQFKVQYNDRRITAESYVAESIDVLKQRFKEFTKQFGKPQVREEVRQMLEQRILDICSEVYWTDQRVATLSKICAGDPYWQTRADMTSAALTKSGIGRASTQLVVDILMRNMERITSNEPFVNHPEARRKLMDFSNEILRNKFHTTVDQVENTIKPYKFEVECTEQEWNEGVKRAVHLIDTQLAQAQKEIQEIMSSVGRRKLRNAIQHLQKHEKQAQLNSQATKFDDSIEGEHNFSYNDQVALAESLSNGEGPASNMKLLDRARQAANLQNRIQILQLRSAALKSRQCRVMDNKGCCPEAFLEVVAEKLTYTAVMFIYVELLNEFFFQLPREVDNKLYYDLSRSEILSFAKENPHIQKHLEAQERKMTLELVMEKLRELTRNNRK